jgi:hypothetical protein
MENFVPDLRAEDCRDEHGIGGSVFGLFDSNEFLYVE